MYEIKALDTLFFRDGKPFNKGVETVADTIFPPFPSTIYGAFRTAYFNHNMEIFQELLGTKQLNTEFDPTTKLKITNFFISEEESEKEYYPLPANVLSPTGKDKDNYDIKVLTQLSKTDLSDKNLAVFENDSQIPYKYKFGYLNKGNFINYLSARYDKIYDIDYESLFELEPKIGIAIDKNSHTSQDNNLYRIDLLRLKEDTVLKVEITGLDLPDNFVMKLGGEGKYVAVKKVQHHTPLPKPAIDKKFVIYLQTPAIFTQGWLPEWLSEDDYTGIIPHTGIKVKLITANIGKPLLIGGFDMAKNKPKPMFKAVPAGSIYLVELLAGQIEEIEEKKISSLSDKYAEQGFGLFKIGKF
jgi:CRISPR-associated protein Cmr3